MSKSVMQVQSIEKRVGATVLFSELRFTVPEHSRIGIIGENGCGKSTLLRLLAGEEEPDAGEILHTSGLQCTYIPQRSVFPQLQAVSSRTTGQEVLEHSGSATNEYADAAFQRTLSALTANLALPDLSVPIERLSGGEQKRLQLVAGLSNGPDVILLDEPTNHLDIESRESLERIISASDQTWLVVTHDRWLLQSVCDHILELNNTYPGGALLVEGDYQEFLKRRQELLDQLQNEAQRLSTQARREQAWLRQGAKARSTKSKHRRASAYALLESLQHIRSQNTQRSLNFAFDSTSSRSKELINADAVTFGYTENAPLISDFSMTLCRGEAVGILGPNGSGKSTLLGLIRGTLQPSDGVIRKNPAARIAVFEQNDPHKSSKETLRNFFAPDGDSVVFRDESIHVASWAQRFGFSHEQLTQPLASLSGGERARARLAMMLLEPADILLLDEPTNDLDIKTLDVLEESLLSFDGALLLISHDRYFLSRVCTKFVGVESNARWGYFATLSQWLESTNTDESPGNDSTSTTDASANNGALSNTPSKNKPGSSRKLSFKEQREYDTIERSIAESEAKVELIEAEIAVASGQELSDLCDTLSAKQKEIDSLYLRWEELEKKLAE